MWFLPFLFMFFESVIRFNVKFSLKFKFLRSYRTARRIWKIGLGGFSANRYVNKVNFYLLRQKFIEVFNKFGRRITNEK
jgi:hypothetical protein